MPASRSTAERSAGVVVYRPLPRRKHTFLLLDYGRYWDFPKGHVEAGEDDLAAAVRELQEETGIKSDQARMVDGFIKEITYFFRARGQLIRKQVVFFLAESNVDDNQITISHEHVGFAFLAYDEALARLKYPTAKEVLKDAELFLAGPE